MDVNDYRYIYKSMVGDSYANFYKTIYINIYINLHMLSHVIAKVMHVCFLTFDKKSCFKIAPISVQLSQCIMSCGVNINWSTLAW